MKHIASVFKSVSSASMTPAAALAALDVVIGFYALALIVALVTGGFDMGWLSVREASKPLLVLWVLVPIRVALYYRPTPVPRLASVGAAMRRALSAIAARVPPAVRDVAFAFGITRLAATSVGFLVNLLYPADRMRPFQLPFDSAKLAETFAAWDSGWYFDIAKQGYYYTPQGQSSITFFPLYPLLMRTFAWPFGSTDAAIWAAGIAISCTSFLLGLIALHRLTHDMFGDRDIARRTVLYVCVFPFSFFMMRVYPSGLFLLLTVLAVAAAYRSRWIAAGLFGGLAALTRPQGILIALPLLIMAGRNVRGRELIRRVAALSPIALAFIAFNVYIGVLAGHPLAWLAGEGQWGFSLGHLPWEQLLGLLGKVERYGPYDYFFTSNVAPYHLFHGVAALFLLAITPLVFVRMGAPFGAYVLVSALVPLSGNGLEGIGRYVAVLFPVFMTLATIKSPRLHEALLIVWSLFLALFVGLFATWRPIY